MPRKTFFLTALLACLTTGAMLIAPAATASSSHYNCARDYMYMRDSRLLNARITLIYNYFDDHATGAVEEGIRRLQENAGGPEANLHTIHAYYESYLSYAYEEGMYYLYSFCQCHVRPRLYDCPSLFGRNVAYCNSTCASMSRRNVALRDQLAAALEAALAGTP